LEYQIGIDLILNTLRERLVLSQRRRIGLLS